MVLSSTGADVEAVGEGRAALRALEARPFDVLIADLSMPDCDGHELVRAVRARHPSIRIVSISGLSAAQLRVSMLLGADVALPKPFTGSQLLEVVNCTRPTCIGEGGCAATFCQVARHSASLATLVSSPPPAPVLVTQASFTLTATGGRAVVEVAADITAEELAKAIDTTAERVPAESDVLWDLSRLNGDISDGDVLALFQRARCGPPRTGAVAIVVTGEASARPARAYAVLAAATGRRIAVHESRAAAEAWLRTAT